jgi:hypothetical protein
VGTQRMAQWSATVRLHSVMQESSHRLDQYVEDLIVA